MLCSSAIPELARPLPIGVSMAKKTTKKKVTKKAPRRRKPVESFSKGFGHLTIPKDVKIKDSGVVHEEDKDIDSLECWESYDWEDE